MSRSRSRTIAEAWAALTLLAGLAAAPAAGVGHPWRFPHAEGATVRFEGTVADASGRPIRGVEVVLEAATPRFDWRRFSPDQRLERRVARTDEQGRFSIDWTWDGTFRRFELVATLREVAGSRELARELARLEVTDRVRAGTPVPAALVVEDAAGLARVREFLADLDSADELAVWNASGLPEAIDRVVGPESVEATWWYYSDGRAYRFRDGARVAVETFPPVRSFTRGEAP